MAIVDELTGKLVEARDEFQRFLQMYDRYDKDVQSLLKVWGLEDAESKERREQLLKTWRVIKKVPK